MLPFREPYSMLCYSADGSEVDTVIIDGRVVYLHKEFKTIDTEELYYQIAKIKEVI